MELGFSRNSPRDGARKRTDRWPCNLPHPQNGELTCAKSPGGLPIGYWTDSRDPRTCFISAYRPSLIVRDSGRDGLARGRLLLVSARARLAPSRGMEPRACPENAVSYSILALHIPRSILNVRCVISDSTVDAKEPEQINVRRPRGETIELQRSKEKKTGRDAIH